MGTVEVRQQEAAEKACDSDRDRMCWRDYSPPFRHLNYVQRQFQGPESRNVFPETRKYQKQKNRRCGTLKRRTGGRGRDVERDGRLLG
jgi:hypothetical protein